VEYCSSTMKAKLPSSLNINAGVTGAAFGKYEVRKPLDHNLSCYKWASGKDRPARPEYSEDRDQPGPGHYPVTEHKSVGGSTSCPNLKGRRLDEEAAGGTKRCVKSTFGCSERFPGSKMSCSPQGDMYYAHSRIMTSEDYLAGTRSCSLGGGDKVDLTNPYKAPRLQVSAATYTPNTGYGAAMKSSPGLDGFATRCLSPVYAFSPKSGSRTMASTGGRGAKGFRGVSPAGDGGAGRDGSSSAAS
jgi:hypothetical protein